MRNTKEDLLKELEKVEEFCSEELEKIRKKISSTKTLKEDKDLFSITSYSEVCKELNEKEESCPYKQIKQIEKLFNNNWIKDWENSTQQKWFPYFNLRASDGEVGFSDSGYRYLSSHGHVTFYKDKKTSDYIGKTFWSIYKQLM